MGSYIFEGNFITERYLYFLRFELIPVLPVIFFAQRIYPDISNERNGFSKTALHRILASMLESIWTKFFWITADWTRCNWMVTKTHIFNAIWLFFWGSLKEKVYSTRPDNTNPVIARIRIKVNNLFEEVIRNSVEGFYHHFKHLLENGGHFQHFVH